MDPTEKLLLDIKNENLSSVSETMSAESDPSRWKSALKQEMSIISLIDGVLETDIMLPRLVVCGLRTVAPLHYAALRGADDILKEFWRRSQISPDVPLSGGSTALHYACFAGNLSTLGLLVDDMKADLNCRDCSGWSPLHYSSIGGQLEAAEQLCRRGADVTHRDRDGFTAPQRAQMFGHEGIVEFFKSIWKGDPGMLFESAEAAASKPSGLSVYSVPDKQKRNSNDNDDNKSSKDKSFLVENAYDFPDDLVARIQCKHEPDILGVGLASMYGLPVGSRGSNPSTPSSPTPLPDRERSKKKIQDLVKSQLQEVFESGRNSEDAYESVDADLPNIGFRTLKYLLRNEFQKYKSSGALSRNSNSNSNNNGDKSGDKSGANGSSDTTKATVTDSPYDERNIYEEIVKPSVVARENKWIKGGQTIRSRFDPSFPPPLPPRNSILDEQTFKPSPAVDLQRQGQRPRDSYNREFNRASVRLNQIEETQLVREACFGELVPLLGPGDWQKLALALPIRQNCFLANEKVSAIERQYPKDRKRQARAALHDWNRHFGRDATLERLVEAMKKCGFVEKIRAVEAANQKE